MLDVVPELADPRVRYHRHPENLGVMHAVAAGLRELRGEFFAHMDDDDEWASDFLSEQVRLLEAHPSAALSFCDHWVMSEDGSLDEPSTVSNSAHWGRLALSPGLHEPAYEIAFRGSIPIASAAVVRRTTLDLSDVPAELSFAWDLWLAYLATRTGRGVVYNPTRLSRKRRHAAQLMSAVAPTSNLTDLVIVYERLWSEPSFAVNREQLTDRLSEASANWSVALMRDGQHAAALNAAQRSIAVKVTLRGCIALAASRLPSSWSTRAAQTASAGFARWRRLTQASLLGRGSY